MLEEIFEVFLQVKVVHLNLVVRAEPGLLQRKYYILARLILLLTPVCHVIE